MQHANEDDIEHFVLGRLSPDVCASVAAHLIVCPVCLHEYEATCDFVATLDMALNPETAPMMEIHQTSDGPVRLHLRRNGDVWVGTLRGLQINSGAFGLSRAHAEKSIRTTFEQMFPEHRCTTTCYQKIYPLEQVS